MFWNFVSDFYNCCQVQESSQSLRGVQKLGGFGLGEEILITVDGFCSVLNCFLFPISLRKNKIILITPVYSLEREEKIKSNGLGY